VEPSGATRLVAEGLHGPNGMRLSADGATLLVAESFARRITAFDVDRDGELSGRRVFADLGDRMPDGICVDGAGAVWAACGSAGIVRVSDGGTVLDVVETPGRWAVDCTLGGAELDWLYCGTATTDIERHLAGDDHGAIERLQVTVPGAGRA
jgi:sugar lactone lactonase YvrE